MSCEQLIEKTSPLDGIYYIIDGWEKFEAEDYDRAHDLFSTVLLNNSTQYFPDAYIGCYYLIIPWKTNHAPYHNPLLQIFPSHQ
jgi:hypothetical protein